MLLAPPAAPAPQDDDFRELSAATQIFPELRLPGQSIMTFQGKRAAEGPEQERSL